MSEVNFDFQSLEWRDYCDDPNCHEYHPRHHSHNFAFENNLSKECSR